MHTLLTLAYHGGNYHGFQVQQNAVTVCEVLQNALQQLYGIRPPVKGCSRTDAGVHASGYCVSFTQPKAIALEKLPLALNHFLPQDIRVLAAKEVPEGFHARYDSVSKEYVYHIYCSNVDDVFRMGQYWRVASQLDAEKMHIAAQQLVGQHNFSAFMSSGSSVQNTVRTVYFCNVTQNGKWITVHICANGYLYNMVRIIVGTLVEIGAAHSAVQTIATALASGVRTDAGPTAPPQGLFLFKVNY